MPTQTDQSQGFPAVEHALAQQRLEGLEVPPDVVADMNRAARGEMSIEEGIRETLRKGGYDEIRRDGPLPR